MKRLREDFIIFLAYLVCFGVMFAAVIWGIPWAINATSGINSNQKENK